MTKCVGSRGGLGKCAESERAVGIGTKAGYATSAEASRDAQLGRRKTGKLYEMVGGLVKKSAINCKTTPDLHKPIAQRHQPTPHYWYRCVLDRCEFTAASEDPGLLHEPVIIVLLARALLVGGFTRE